MVNEVADMSSLKMPGGLPWLGLAAILNRGLGVFMRLQEGAS